MGNGLEKDRDNARKKNLDDDAVDSPSNENTNRSTEFRSALQHEEFLRIASTRRDDDAGIITRGDTKPGPCIPSKLRLQTAVAEVFKDTSKERNTK